MSTTLKQNAGYNLSRLKYWRRHRNRLLTLRITLLALIFVGVSGIFANYLANLPRERHAKNANYLERTTLGAKQFVQSMYLAINAEQEDPFTKLPKAEIYISGKRLDDLNASLPESGRNEQRAKFKYKGVEDDVVVRYRGDSINHWALPHKSWRVIARKDNRMDQMSELNLNLPRADNQIANWLGYKIARQFGKIIVPDSELVHFRLNRKYDGIRLLLEQPNLEFLEKRELPPGKIFTGDIDSTHIYGSVPRKQLYLDSSAWSVTSGSPDISTREISQLLRLIGQEHNPYTFYYQLEKLIDVPGILHYIAMLELVGSVHIDSTHNGKFYYNNLSGLMSPIAWDTVAYFWKDTTPFDLAPNQLFRVILANPGYREEKDRLLWAMINDTLSIKNLHQDIDNIVQVAGNDIKAFDLKIHANDKGIKYISNPEWSKSIDELKAAITSRNTRLAERLQQTDVEYNFIPTDNKKTYQLLVQVNSPVGIHLNQILLDSKGVQNATLTRIGLDELQKPLDGAKSTSSVASFLEQQKFNIKDHLFSKRRFVSGQGLILVPGLYRYKISYDQAPTTTPQATLAITNFLTGKGAPAKFNPNIQLPSVIKPNSVWWNPEDFLTNEAITLEGERTIDRNLVIDRFQTLTIKAGTKLKLAPRVSIIIDGGKLIVEGTKESPVVISALEQYQPWGGIAALNHGELKISHLTLSGGSSAQYNYVRFDGSLALHYAHGKIDHLTSDTILSNLYSNLTLSHSKFSTIFENPIILKNSNFKETANEYLTQDVSLQPEYLNIPAVGTPGRSEREFKYTFMNLDPSKENPMNLAEELRLALANSLNFPENWKVPKLVNSNYYVDDKVKDFLFRDIYFDTQDRLNHQFDVAYRYRNRYPSGKAYEYHNEDYSRTAYWPYRLEFQAKTERNVIAPGLSDILENRFEFRKESLPFSDQYIPPLAPWDERYFIKSMQSGYFDGMLTYPAKGIMEFYQDKIEPGRSLYFEPSAVLLTTRYRQHFNIKTAWGGGPNPDQSNIISLDHSYIYKAEPYVKFLEARHLGNDQYPEPKPDGEIVEIELEFERNVSDKLDRAIAQAEKDGSSDLEYLTEVRKAFHHDLNQIMEVVSAAFAERGVVVEPNSRSKYVQSMDQLEGELGE